MARIRLIEIANFRGIKKLSWHPKPGINCLIGPGDNGKSTVLDAIDLCLGARRSYQFVDADFFGLDVSTPVRIDITIGDLSDSLKRLDAYGLYLRSYDPKTKLLEDEPETSAETVLTLSLSVSSDLEPVWSIFSDRATAQDQTRNLNWNDRTAIAPTRLGVFADNNLAWRRGSVLNRLSDERAEVSAALVGAARQARSSFGDEASKQLTEALDVVTRTAAYLGVPIGNHATAMLDTHSVSFASGTISLHDEFGIPLRGLGTGSARLLVAGLQRTAAKNSSIILIDELEHGLEPHRIIRLLDSLGAKERATPPLQCFATTHSPTVLKELSGDQLLVLRKTEHEHVVLDVGTDDDVQSTIRLYPEAFLANGIIVCEGATEVGLLRGLDQHRSTTTPSMTACGVAPVDGGGIEKLHKRAASLLSLGYRVAIFRDDDVKPKPEDEKSFIDAGGYSLPWGEGRTTEQELFLSVSNDVALQLLAYAASLHGEDLVEDHIKSVSEGAFTLKKCRDDLTIEARNVLGKASKRRKEGWFKSITWMEVAAREIVGPRLESADKGFQERMKKIFAWVDGSARS